MGVQRTRAQDRAEKQRIEAALAEQIERLSALVDDFKLRSHLASVEVRDRTRPHIRNAERGLSHAKADLRDLAGASEEAWPWIHRSLQRSLRGVQTCFGQARRDFSPVDP
jgi:hypothetical protein